MKKYYSKVLALVLALTVFALMAAGSGSSGESSTEKTNTSAAAGSTSAAAGESRSSAAETVSEAAPAEKLTYTISDEIIVDNDYCVFKIIAARDDRIWGFTLDIYCENKTADKALRFSIDDVSINGYMADPLWGKEVAAGKKTNSEINFGSSALKDNGITSPDAITFTLRVYDSENWLADNFVKDTFTVYPTGLTADQIEIPARRTSEKEQVVIDNDKCTFVILGTKNDSIWGYTVQGYIENKTDKTVMCSWDDVSVNGYMIDPYWAKTLASGKRAYVDISFSKSGFEENKITAVEEIEYTLRVYDSNNWMADDLVHEVYRYKP